MEVLRLALFQIPGKQCNASVYDLLVTATVVCYTKGTQINISFLQSVCVTVQFTLK